MTRQSQNLGSLGETLATQYLEKKGFQILKRNLRTKLGEIDILARDRDALVIVEVKTKSNLRLGQAIEMVTLQKRRKLTLLALELQAKYQTESVRIDVVAIDTALTLPSIRYYKGLIAYVPR